MKSIAAELPKPIVSYRKTHPSAMIETDIPGEPIYLIPGGDLSELSNRFWTAEPTAKDPRCIERVDYYRIKPTVETWLSMAEGNPYSDFFIVADAQQDESFKILTVPREGRRYAPPTALTWITVAWMHRVYYDGSEEWLSHILQHTHAAYWVSISRVRFDHWYDVRCYYKWFGAARPYIKAPTLADAFFQGERLLTLRLDPFAPR
jgi:hypothetical protein